MVRVIQHKVTYDGIEYDSRDEYLYHKMLLDDGDVSCIHRQVKVNLIKPVYYVKPRQLKTKIRYDRRLLMNGHFYKADFVFFEGEKIVVCDVKSSFTSKLREFRITAKACLAKIIEHNKKRHDGEPHIVFREAIHIRKNEWKIVDYPPSGTKYY